MAVIAFLTLLSQASSPPKQKTSWVAGVIFIVAIVAVIYFLGFTSQGKAVRDWWSKGRARNRQRTISQVGVKSAGTGAGLACPKCGGTQFKVRRRTSTKLAFGAMSLLGQAKHVRCVTCGTEYRRG